MSINRAQSTRLDTSCDPVVYTAKDLQRILKCGRRQAYELMRSSAFPAIQIGAKRIVERSAFEQWLIHNQGRKFLI